MSNKINKWTIYLVCIITFSVSNGWPTTIPAQPVERGFRNVKYYVESFDECFDLLSLRRNEIYFENLPPTQPAMKSCQYEDDICVELYLNKSLNLR